MLKGGGTTCFEVVLTRELEVLAILLGGGGEKFYPVLSGGGAKTFGPMIFSFCMPRLPVINDRSLISLYLMM